MTKFNLRIRPGKNQNNIHRTTEYRRRIKSENPEEHLIKKEKDRDRKRLETEKLKNDTSREARMKKKKNKEMQAIRQKRYRERKKAEKVAAMSQV